MCATIIGIIKKAGEKLDIDFLEIVKALSNETRLNILKWLRDPAENFPPQDETCDEADISDGVCVSRIREKAGISQSTVSNYLDLMQRAGLLTSVRHGKWTYYRRCEETIRQLSEYIASEL